MEKVAFGLLPPLFSGDAVVAGHHFVPTVPTARERRYDLRSRLRTFFARSPLAAVDSLLKEEVFSREELDGLHGRRIVP